VKSSDSEHLFGLSDPGHSQYHSTSRDHCSSRKKETRKKIRGVEFCVHIKLGPGQDLVPGGSSVMELSPLPQFACHFSSSPHLVSVSTILTQILAQGFSHMFTQLQRAIVQRAARVTAAGAQKQLVRAFASAADDLASCKKTALYDVHVNSNGKMVPFCGYALPVQYADTLSVSHNHCRTKASLFDVSHMGQVRITGEHRIALMEKLCVMDLLGAKPSLAKLSVLTNEKGGVIDDCMITPDEKGINIVLNAGCKDKDMAHIRKHIEQFNAEHPSSDPVRLDYFEDRSLVALQGPKAAATLQSLLPADFDLTKFAFMSSRPTVIKGIPVVVTRCGYTGEDGFEIGCDNRDAVALWDILVNQPDVAPAGLGVRDSLRLEAGLCLYGHELEEDISPVEAGLSWVISPRRKREGGFLGADVILSQLQHGVSRRLVGLEVKEGAPARHGAPVLDQDGNQIGTVTSGGPAPSLNMKKIAMAYVATPHAAVGSQVKVSVRGKQGAAEVVKLPFVQTNYYRVPK